MSPMPCPQDLSMGWLSCDPDDMFKQHVYTGPAVYGKLGPGVQAALSHVGAALPPAITSYLQHTRVVAAPMQVRFPCRLWVS